jgi:UDP-N-acetylglucosamine 2-epimerase (non-hydrolysing)
MQVSLLYILGAGACLAKMAPVVAVLRQRLPDARHVLVGAEHEADADLLEALRGGFGVPEPHYALGLGSGGHGTQTARALESLERIIQVDKPDLVIAPGGSDATLAATLAAVKVGVATAHVDSGLRSFDRSRPEEVNRVVADEFASMLFAGSRPSVDNLLAEGIPANRVHLVGNTMIDALSVLEPRCRELDVAGSLGLERGSYLLVSLRGPVLEDRELLWRALDRLRDLAHELPIVFAIDPRLRWMVDDHPAATSVQIVDVSGYCSLLSLEADAKAVLTDDGDSQEQTTYFGVPCFTLHGATDRPITLTEGTNTLLSPSPDRIPEIATRLERPRPEPAQAPLLWDGNAAERVADALGGALTRMSAVGSR